MHLWSSYDVDGNKKKIIPREEKKIILKITLEVRARSLL
jgi:hypothetical protein